MIHNLGNQNSLLNQFVAELRDVNIQTDKMRFRRNLERLGEIMAYEISKQLEFNSIEVETPLGIANVNVPEEGVVLATILRAGLPLHTGFLNYFDQAENAFITAYRHQHKGGNFEIRIESLACPDLNDKVLILIDPMIASGASIGLTLKQILDRGQPKSIHVAAAICSSYGINHVQRLHEKVDIWTCAIDEELTAKSYIVPGLGDAGDLAFGGINRD